MYNRRILLACHFNFLNLKEIKLNHLLIKLIQGREINKYFLLFK